MDRKGLASSAAVRYSTASLMAAALAGSAAAQTGNYVTISGATLFEGFFQSPASTNDSASDVDGDGVITDFTVPSFDQLAGTFFDVQYRGTGSGDGFEEFVGYNALNGPAAGSWATIEANDTADPSLRNGTPVSTPNFFGPAIVDIGVMDVPSTWFVTQPGKANWDAAPATVGYGNSGITSNATGSGAGDQAAGQSNGLESLTPTVAGSNGNTLNFNTGPSNDNATVYDTELAWVPIAFIANYGTGIDGEDADDTPDGNIKKSELQHLFVTGRMDNGENLVATTRDSGSGTRNGAMNSIGVDPSWGTGENTGLSSRAAPNDDLGDQFIGGNKNSSSRLEDTVQNHRLSVGYTGIVDNAGDSKAADHYGNGQIEILNVMNDTDGGTVYVRPQMLRPGQFLGVADDAVGLDTANDVFFHDVNDNGVRDTGENNTIATHLVNNVIFNGNANEGWQVGGAETFATLGDPNAGTIIVDQATNAVRYDDGSPLGANEVVTSVGTAPASHERMEDPAAALYIRNITESIATFQSAPNDPANDGTPGQLLGTSFAATDAVEFLPLVSDPDNFEPSAVNTALQAAGVLPLETDMSAGWGGVSLGRTPLRIAGSYTDGETGGNYITNDGQDIQENVNMSAANPIDLRNAIAGDFDGDGDRDKDDVDDMVTAYLNSGAAVYNGGAASFVDAAGNTVASRDSRASLVDPIVAGELADTDGNASLEVLGDFNGDGNYDLEDVRYFADGLGAKDGSTGETGNVVNRKFNFTAVDNATPGGNLFGTTLGNAGSLNANYDAGDSRGDIFGGVQAAGADPTGDDGKVDADDIDYVYEQFKWDVDPTVSALVDLSDGVQWGNINEVAGKVFADGNRVDLSADMTGDLSINQADVDDLVQGVLGTNYGDADLDGSVGNSDIGAVFGNFDTSATNSGWASGSFDGDGDVDNGDIGTVFGNFGAPAPTSGVLSTAGIIAVAGDPARADLVYDLTTGEVTLDGSEAAGGVITNFVLTSDGEFINTAALSNPFAGVFFTATEFEISASDPLTTGLSQIGLGTVLAPGLNESELASLLTGFTYVGSLGSGQLELDLVVIPEPTAAALLGIGGLLLTARRRRD
ncbi:MAG: PEP-CTERM sorting domain-containing protein [Planctomycetota bacterium]